MKFGIEICMLFIMTKGKKETAKGMQWPRPESVLENSKEPMNMLGSLCNK